MSNSPQHKTKKRQRVKQKHKEQNAHRNASNRTIRFIREEGQ